MEREKGKVSKLFPRFSIYIRLYKRRWTQKKQAPSFGLHLGSICRCCAHPIGEAWAASPSNGCEKSIFVPSVFSRRSRPESRHIQRVAEYLLSTSFDSGSPSRRRRGVLHKSAGLQLSLSLYTVTTLNGHRWINGLTLCDLMCQRIKTLPRLLLCRRSGVSFSLPHVTMKKTPPTAVESPFVVVTLSPVPRVNNEIPSSSRRL